MSWANIVGVVDVAECEQENEGTAGAAGDMCSFVISPPRKRPSACSAGSWEGGDRRTRRHVLADGAGPARARPRCLAGGLTRVISEISGEPIEQMFLVIREMPGFNFVDAGEHVAEYVARPDGVDLAGTDQLRARGIITK
jgi:phenylpyruvate tautomerase PptA (4-oxalocrotonate tautomerase family)